MIDSLVTAFRAPDIRRKILFTLGILFIFRVLTNVPVAGVDQARLSQLFESNQLLGLLDLFSGGGLATASIIGMGVNPYINASIIMQLMQGVIPSLGELAREGEYGRNRLNQYTRLLTVPMAFAQGYGFSVLLAANGVIPQNPFFSFETLSLLLSWTAGTILLMWLGELISERGLGNGISFIIFAGIVGRIPHQAGGVVSGPDGLLRIVPFIIIGVIVIAGVVFINEGQRRIPVQYASRVRGRRMYQGQTQYLPLKVTMAGVIPIIFAISILLLPAQLAAYFSTSSVEIVSNISKSIVTLLSPNSPLYIVFYFLLTVGFTYFYTAFTFKPDETADQLRKNGGFIPGIRPGNPTRDYLAKVVTRISLAGALFLGTVAVSPSIISAIFSSSVLGSLSLGGTALLIVVSVVVETMKQLEAQLMMRNYEGFIR